MNPRQHPLPFDAPARAPQTQPHAAANAYAAALFLRDPARYGGEGALVVAWARLWSARGEVRA